MPTYFCQIATSTKVSSNETTWIIACSLTHYCEEQKVLKRTPFLKKGGYVKAGVLLKTV